MHSHSHSFVLAATFCLALAAHFGPNRAAGIGTDLPTVTAPATPERSAYAADLLAADRVGAPEAAAVAGAGAVAGAHENESARKSRQILFTYPFGLYKGYPAYYGYYPYAYPRYSYTYSYPYYAYSYPRILYG